MEENDCPFQAWQPSPDMFDDDESTPEAEVTDISKEDSLGLPEEARNNPNWMREEGFLSPRSSEDDLDSEKDKLEASTSHRYSTPKSTRMNRKRPHSMLMRSHSPSPNELTKSIKEIKTLLKVVCNKVEKNEKTLKTLQNTRSSTSSSESSSPKSQIKRSKDIPNNIKHEVRKIYATLFKENDTFLGWEIGKGTSIDSPHNCQVMQTLIKEVTGLNPSFESSDVRGAAYRFYRSKCDAHYASVNGKTELLKTRKRRHERIVRKKKEREAALMSNKILTEEQRVKWLSAVRNELMSSEESGSDDNIIVHTLPWRSQQVIHLFQKIDKWNQERKSPQALRQMKNRHYGSPSTRSPPLDCPEWAICKKK